MPHPTQCLRFGGSLADTVRSTNLLTYLLTPTPLMDDQSLCLLSTQTWKWQQRAFQLPVRGHPVTSTDGTLMVNSAPSRGWPQAAASAQESCCWQDDHHRHWRRSTLTDGIAWLYIDACSPPMSALLGVYAIYDTSSLRSLRINRLNYHISVRCAQCALCGVSSHSAKIVTYLHMVLYCQEKWFEVSFVQFCEVIYFGIWSKIHYHTVI